MGSYKRGQKLFLDNYKAINAALCKVLIVFAMSVFLIISVFDGDTQLDTSKSKVAMVARWKRSDDAVSSGLPYTDFRNSSNKIGYEFWKSIKPSFECPHRLFRKVGDVGDAGYWMCGLEVLGDLEKKEGSPPPCHVYSTGSKENIFFEVEVMSVTNCSIYAYEPSAAIVDHPFRYFEGRVKLENLSIGGRDRGEMRTLKTLMQKNGGHQWIDVLKLNVGEGDIQALEKILEDFSESENLPIGQLFVRLKVPNWRDDFSIGDQIVDIFEELETRGLRMFHKEINPWHRERVADFSFVNTKKLNLFLQEKDLALYKTEKK